MSVKKLFSFATLGLVGTFLVIAIYAAGLIGFFTGMAKEENDPKKRSTLMGLGITWFLVGLPLSIIMVSLFIFMVGWVS